MQTTLTRLLERMKGPAAGEAGIIPWSCPVPVFGRLADSRIATLGINPSNREFVDESGKELDGPSRRLHTLKSLRLQRWSDANHSHLELIEESCYGYFSRNPYNSWFKRLDDLISGTRTSFYNNSTSACHLDLIPFATERKWTDLTHRQRSALLATAGDTFGMLLNESSVRMLILNGNSVVSKFEEISGLTLESKVMPGWSLPRRCNSVKGFAYKGFVRRIGGVKLKHDVMVLGYNHNIQSSFGVTKNVISAIRLWITEMVGSFYYEAT